jgi:hypothetical protein
VDLKRFDNRNWKATDEDLEFIGDYLYSIRHYPILAPEMISRLKPASAILQQAVFMGADEEGLFKPVKFLET